MSSHESKPIRGFRSADEWEQWLEVNAAASEGVRLKTIKAKSTAEGISYAEALDVALCFGWIDSQANAFDEDFSLRVFGPRRPKGIWSQINRDHIARLTEAGRMRPSGLAEVEAAKADGRWDAAYRQKDAPVPDDLAKSLAASPAAAAAFAGLSSQNRFAILFRIGAVKRAETRAAKIVTFVGMLERGETIYPQKPARKPAQKPAQETSQKPPST